MAETTARLVADYFVFFLSEHGDPVTNLKLQKLLYYAQGWNLALCGEPLFAERIEAWVHGPAVPPIYGEFKKWEWKPIDPPKDEVKLDETIAAYLNEIIDAYGGFGSYELERLSHSEAPWIEARAGLPPDAPSNAIITHESLKTFFGKKLDAED